MDNMQVTLRPCPECRRSTTFIDSRKNWHCPRCGWTTAAKVAWKPTERQEIVADLYNDGLIVSAIARVIGTTTTPVYADLKVLKDHGLIADRSVADIINDNKIKELYEERRTQQFIADAIGKPKSYVQKRIRELLDIGEIVSVRESRAVEARKLKNKGLKPKEIASRLGITLQYVYMLLSPNSEQ